MIASKVHRKLGLATEALQLFLSYIRFVSLSSFQEYFPTINCFFVKISVRNTISQHLFQKFGFELFSSNAIFQEHEYRLRNDNISMPLSLVAQEAVANTKVNPNHAHGGDAKAIAVYKSQWKDNNFIDVTIVSWKA